jgi:hypothetical protein
MWHPPPFGGKYNAGKILRLCGESKSGKIKFPSLKFQFASSVGKEAALLK